MQNLLLIGCSALVHTCKLQVCNSVVKKSTGGRLAFVLEKRLDFHPSDPMLNLAGGKGRATAPRLFIVAGVGYVSVPQSVSSKVAVAYRIHCRCGCELMCHWQVFTDSSNHIDIM